MSGLLICQSQISRSRTKEVEKIGNKPKSKLLVEIDAEGNAVESTDQPKARGLTTSSEDLRRGVERGMSWLAANFGVDA